MFMAILLVVSTLAASPAYADRGHWSGGCWGCGAWVLGAVIAADIAITQSAQQPVYVAPAPVYVQPSPAPVYVQPAPPQPPVQSWYFCKSVNGYYPYVRNCPEGWQAIPITPPN